MVEAGIEMEAAVGRGEGDALGDRPVAPHLGQPLRPTAGEVDRRLEGRPW